MSYLLESRQKLYCWWNSVPSNRLLYTLSYWWYTVYRKSKYIGTYKINVHTILLFTLFPFGEEAAIETIDIMSTLSVGSIAFGRPVHHNSGTSEHGSTGASWFKTVRFYLLELEQLQEIALKWSIYLVRALCSSCCHTFYSQPTPTMPTSLRS